MQKQGETQKIYFYGKNAQHGQFSNFYSSPFWVDNKKYKTVQHYFQSQKFKGKDYEMKIINSQSPFDAFKLGRTRNIPIRPDWEEVKEAVMLQGLLKKFSIKEFREKLLQTGNKQIIQHTSKDKYWADGGGQGKGKNRLGVLLMQVRQLIQDKKI